MLLRAGLALVGLFFLANFGNLCQAADPPASRGKAIKITTATALKTSPETAMELATARVAKPSRDGDSTDFYALADEPVAGERPNKFIVANLEFKDDASRGKFQHQNIHPFASVGRFMDVFALNDDATIEAIDKAAGIAWYELVSTVSVPPPARPLPKKETARDLPNQIVRGGLDGLSGKGVIIAVIDTGLDFRHPDFITYDKQGRPTSRLMYLWDVASDLHASGVGVEAPIKFPSGAAIGTIYNRDLLTADLRSAKPRITVTDPNGHGTSCAGLAAGNGNANQDYAGVAPQADLIGIRADHDGDNMLDSVYLTSAFCAWLDEVAGDRPMVVSCSWGGQQGGRDGQRICERHLSERFPLERRGRAACFSAGNDGYLATHASVEVGQPDDPSHLTWKAAGKATLALFLQSKGDLEIEIGGLDETKLDEQGVKSFVHPLTNQMIVTVPVSGSGGLFIASEQGAGIACDAYLRGTEALFTEESSELSKGISTPSGAANLLCVGSYDWNDQFHHRGSVMVLPDDQLDAPLLIGGLSTYSSRGPIRFGSATKPELVAPGQYHTAPAPLNVVTLRDSTGLYQVFNGTSAATPYTAGVIALMLEAAPHLTWGEIRELLAQNVTQDPRTGKCPNGKWGHGKLDYPAVEKLLAATRKHKPVKPAKPEPFKPQTAPPASP